MRPPPGPPGPGDSGDDGHEDHEDHEDHEQPRWPRREAEMTRMNREAIARRLLERPPPPVPPGLHAEAVRRGTRILRRRTLGRRALWLLLFAAAVAFTVWALTVRPWVEPPKTPPPLTGW